MGGYCRLQSPLAPCFPESLRPKQGVSPHCILPHGPVRVQGGGPPVSLVSHCSEVSPGSAFWVLTSSSREKPPLPAHETLLGAQNGACTSPCLLKSGRVDAVPTEITQPGPLCTVQNAQPVPALGDQMQPSLAGVEGQLHPGLLLGTGLRTPAWSLHPTSSVPLASGSLPSP